jgi:Carboxylesterase type B
MPGCDASAIVPIPSLLARDGVVVLSLNYRLGSFGFLRIQC